MVTKSKYERTLKFGGKEGETVIIKKLKFGKYYKLTKIFSEILSSLAVSAGKEESVIQNIEAIFSILPQKVLAIVSLCSGLSEKEIEEKAFPSEIELAWRYSYELNDPTSIKNLVAPIQGGAEVIPDTHQ